MDILLAISAMRQVTALAMGIRPIAYIITSLIIAATVLIAITDMDPDITVGQAAITGAVVMEVGEGMVVGAVMVDEEGDDDHIGVFTVYEIKPSIDTLSQVLHTP